MSDLRKKRLAPTPDRTAWWGLLAGAVAFGVLMAPLWLAPGSHLFGTTEDGLKNYYTAAWYVLHDHGLHFTGMNYPFGEHVVFTDDQPLLALLLRRLRGGAPGVTVARVMGVVNLLMLLAQVVSVPVLAALLRRCRLPVAYSVGAATLIALLAPQLVRMLGHYALAYSCVVPMLWYCLVRAFEEPRRAVRWWLTYGMLTLLLGCLHPYYLLVSALLMAAYLVVGWWQADAVGRRQVGFWVGGGLALLGPLVIFQGGLLLTDPYAPDRLSTPYGFLEYSTSVWSVFFPVETPIREAWQGIFHTPDPTWEGHAYVGLTATIIAVLTLMRLGRRLRARQWRRLRLPALPPPLRTGLWAATLVLLFAMGWPFRWGLQGLLDLLGPLRQFRSIGRFAWIFYYIFSVYAAYALYQGVRMLRQRGRTGLALGVLIGGLSLWSAEALFNGISKADKLLHPRHGAERTLMGTATDPTAFPYRLAVVGRRSNEFQAILPIPFYSLGSEKLGTLRSDRSGYYSMRASLETGLPIATAMLSRTALWQAQSLVQLLSHPAIDKIVLPTFPSRQPLLLVMAAGAPRDSAEERLLAQARVFYRDSAVWLAELPLTALTGSRAALVARFDSLRPTLHFFGPNSYLAATAAPGTVINGLDDGDDPRAAAKAAAVPGLLGKGARAVHRDGLDLFDGPVPAAGPFEASVWAYLRTEGLPWLHLSQSDATGKEIERFDIEPITSTNVLGDWVRLTATTTVRQRGNRLHIWLDGRRFVADEFCLRPATAEIWRRDPISGTLVWNNYPLPAQAPLPAGRPGAKRP